MPLTPPDAAFVARDPALPGLALLLDPDRLAATLGAYLPVVDIIGLETTYLRYKPETSCLAGLELNTSEGRVALAAKAFKPHRYAVERRRPVPRHLASPLGPVVLPLDRHAVLCRLVPYDRDLRALPKLADPERRRALLDKLVPALARLDWRMLRHKPGRRHIGLLHQGPSGQAIVKLHARGHFAQALLGARFGAAIGGAALLADSDRYGILVSAWQPGLPLAERPACEPSTLAEMAAAGAALAAVHRHRSADLSQRTIASEIDAFGQSTASLAWLAPNLTAQAATLARAVARLLHASPVSVVALHGDFSADQVIVGDRDVRLIDWDRAGMGPAALDLASFVARLEADALLAGKPLPRAAIDSFIHGYASDAGQRPDALEAWVAAALLRLLGEPFRQRLPDWPARTASLLDRVDRLVVTSESRRRRKLEIPA